MIELFNAFINKDEAMKQISNVFDSKYMSLGPKVKEFENQLSHYFNNDKVLTINSCTSGLQLALHLLKAPDKDINWPGLNSKDEVLSTPLTFVASNWSILTNNLNIRWCDIDPCNANININDIKKKLSPRTKVIMIVHWGGYPVDLDKLTEIQDYSFEKYGFKPVIIEDCAHAFGSEYKGKKIGNHNNINVFSFQAIKTLTTCDGGCIVLPTKKLYERAKLLRWFGVNRDKRTPSKNDFRLESDISEYGFKYNMNDLNAAIGIANLKCIHDLLRINKSNYEYYNKNINKPYLLENKPYCISSGWLFTIKIPRKLEFIKYMKDNGVVVSQVNGRNDQHSCVSKFMITLPLLDEFEKEMICIPVGYWVTNDNRKRIVGLINSWN